MSMASDSGRPKITSGALKVEKECKSTHARNKLIWSTQLLLFIGKDGKLLPHSSTTVARDLTYRRESALACPASLLMFSWPVRSLSPWVLGVFERDPPALCCLVLNHRGLSRCSSVHSMLWLPASTRQVIQFRELPLFKPIIVLLSIWLRSLYTYLSDYGSDFTQLHRETPETWNVLK